MEDYDLVLAVNTRGQFFAMQQATRHMRREKGLQPELFEATRAVLVASSEREPLHPHIALRQDGMRDADGFFWNTWDWLRMHGHGFPPRFMNSFFFSVSHISSQSRFANSPTISVWG